MVFGLSAQHLTLRSCPQKVTFAGLLKLVRPPTNCTFPFLSHFATVPACWAGPLPLRRNRPRLRVKELSQCSPISSLASHGLSLCFSPLLWPSANPLFLITVTLTTISMRRARPARQQVQQATLTQSCKHRRGLNGGPRRRAACQRMRTSPLCAGDCARPPHADP